MANTTQLDTPSPTLLFIPDISGFTDFVSNTEITHSQHIIQELLEVIIEANEIGLEVSEIEGDAVLFYRNGPKPTAAELLAQVQRMYTKFHGHLVNYSTQRICHCGACISANSLTLKFVLHYGDIAIKEVKSFRKLFGKDLIIAHQLMKNKVPYNEYVLFTHDLLNACSAWVDMKAAAWSDPEEGADSYDLGTVNYCYLSLEELRKHVPPPSVGNYMAPKADQQYDSFERIIAAPLEVVFSVLTDLTFRAEWIPFLTGVSELNTKISQNSSAHRCVITGDVSDPYFIDHNFNIKSDVITFVETEPTLKLNVFYTLKRIGRGLTRVERIHYSKNGFINKIKYLINGKKANAAWVNGALDNFKEYCEKLEQKGEAHPSEIILPKD
ncbi:MAG: DUF2652 domain-containing protein [Bacteroidetes bacterium]|nr:DUF2652 domain-containing protein [Bacteroidota bacterium]MDA1122205.1 DUF2652 domain-containing protein [Bacteroidota bacterium]